MGCGEAKSFDGAEARWAAGGKNILTGQRLGNFHLVGTFVLDLSLGNFHWGSFAWELRLGSSALKLSIGHFYLGYFVWEVSLENICFTTFVWDHSLRHFRFGALSLQRALKNFVRIRSGISAPGV